MALTLIGAQGILGSALFDHFAVGYSPRRGELTLKAWAGPFHEGRRIAVKGRQGD